MSIVKLIGKLGTNSMLQYYTFLNKKAIPFMVHAILIRHIIGRKAIMSSPKG